MFNQWIKKHHRYLKVCLVGSTSLIIQLILFNILRVWLSATLSNAIAIECAIINNFFVNNFFTFKDKRLSISLNTKLIKKFIQFNCYSLGSLGLQILVLYMGIHILKPNRLTENILVCIGIFLGSIVNYLIYTRIVWRHKN